MGSKDIFCRSPEIRNPNTCPPCEQGEAGGSKSETNSNFLRPVPGTQSHPFGAGSQFQNPNDPNTKQVLLISVHPETLFLDVILRSKATKNLIVKWSAEILRFAQNDMKWFPEGN